MLALSLLLDKNTNKINNIVTSKIGQLRKARHSNVRLANRGS